MNFPLANNPSKQFEHPVCTFQKMHDVPLANNPWLGSFAKTMRSGRSRAARGAGAAAVKSASAYVRRRAGPPAPFGDTIVWTVVSIAAYCSFLLFPGKVSSPLSLTTRRGMNDLANTGSHLFFCVWVWPVMDYVYRFLAVLLMAPPHAAQFLPQLFASAAVVEDMANGPSATVSLLRSIRSLFVDHNRDAEVAAMYPGLSDAASAGEPPPKSPLFIHGYFTHREVFTVTMMVMGVGWMWATWLYHSRHVVRLWNDEKARKAARKAAQAKKPVPTKPEEDDEEEELDLPHERPGLVPVVSWMTLWSIVYAACWLFVKAMPLLISQVYPVAIGIATAYVLLIPG